MAWIRSWRSGRAKEIFAVCGRMTNQCGRVPTRIAGLGWLEIARHEAANRASLDALAQESEGAHLGQGCTARDGRVEPGSPGPR